MSPSRSVDEANPESPSPIPPPSRVSPLFQAPTASIPRPSSSPSPESSPSPSPHPLDADAGPSWSTDAPSDPSPSAGDSGGIRSIGSELKLSKAGLRTGIGSGFRQVCKLLSAVVASEHERQLGVWTPDVEDVDDVAKPATNLVYRRLPDDAKGGDVIDLFALGLAVVGYVGKALARRAELRTVMQLQEAAGIDVTNGELQT